VSVCLCVYLRALRFHLHPNRSCLFYHLLIAPILVSLDLVILCLDSVPVCGLCASHGEHQGHVTRIVKDVVESEKHALDQATTPCREQVQLLTARMDAWALHDSDLKRSGDTFMQLLNSDFEIVLAKVREKQLALNKGTHMCACVLQLSMSCM
jgi:hypothetical protein